MSLTPELRAAIREMVESGEECARTLQDSEAGLAAECLRAAANLRAAAPEAFDDPEWEVVPRVVSYTLRDRSTGRAIRVDGQCCDDDGVGAIAFTDLETIIAFARGHGKVAR